MRYVGSKRRLAKYILPIVLKDRKDGQFYVEPFVGGFNIMDKVTGNRIANDSNPYLIALYKAVQEGWIPPDNVTEEEYNSVRIHADSVEPHLAGFIGFACSFGGKWFGGYARGKDEKGGDRNYCAEGKRAILRQASLIQGVKIYNLPFQELSAHIPIDSIVYCDPPYAGTVKYNKAGFDYELFWQWVRDLSAWHSVFVSEYKAPDDFVCIWQKEVYNTLDKDTGAKKGTERLFVYEGS